ncbi:hypothetical protein MM1S1540310_1477 [Mycobacteroides abscessus subsp. bolletii 1S-154-0310]|uniref:Helix-turn-helix domain-containing protein n=1 Tax=Mycobacterium parascrofulaceum ATCC BAA-614 TaxID=525368 RepID=D5P6V5_9MYCO|nr:MULTISPECIES: hypothetical protein [Mycobacteriaceae]ALM16387.1 hypothetical protein AOY11_09115 [Mycobacteroides abscessus]AMU50459.1 hypothetical protein A3O01_10150 [Mycobacteroides abscessus]ANO09140.1 hypothetical protein BAB76_10160 [Mycobacteroides abscessus]EFG78181.1 hypothetical protein HMPREF0591_1899 [Mycobacterium parascrofulaceum ATCC BAA-614]EIU61594.1 hypothetical protein MM1S1510930_1920 [Mycobacteroides abscessus subsp. bolletii 1S-151-0930]
MNDDWVISFTFNVDPSMETMDRWETQLEGLDGSVARIPGHGVDVTTYASGGMSVIEAAEKMANEVIHIVHAEPVGMEVMREAQWQRRADEPTLPELMSAAEIAEELGISRQRVHQLRRTAMFPAPLADLRGGAVWDAAAIRKFSSDWKRQPGRPAGDFYVQYEHFVEGQWQLDTTFGPTTEHRAWAFYKQAIEHPHMRYVRLMRGADDLIASHE